MKKLLVLLVVVAFAASAMAQQETINVQVNIQNYATLEVLVDTIILNLSDPADAFSWPPAPGDPPPVDQMGQLRLTSNYVTNLHVTPVSQLDIGANQFIGLVGPGGAELGAWPQITGPIVSGQSMFSHSGTFPLVMSGQYRETAGAHANGLTAAGEGIPAGETIVNVGVSTNYANTPSGDWAPAGEYLGALYVTVVAHP